MIEQTFTNSKIVSLENFEDINDNFVLRSPNKGKIYRGPNWNAFNRESLGSIPRKSENILFQEKTSDVKKGFMSQSERFTEYGKKDSVKFAYPGPGNYTNESLNRSLSTNPSISSRGYGVGFVSKMERFDDAKDYYEKFYPGPGLYKKANISTFDNVHTNMRYKSLYNSKEVPLNFSKDKPGPGYYNPINPSLLTREINENKQHHFFASKDERLKENFFEKEKKKIPGPGKYFIRNDHVIKDPDKTSFFFKEMIPKNDDIVEQHFNIRKKEKYRIPGPGEYNLRMELIDESKINKEKKPILDENKKVQVKQMEQEIDNLFLDNSEKKERILPLKSNSEINPKGIRSVFKSKSPKSNYLNMQHFPGPSYYNPQLWPPKISYNCNVEKTWI